MLPQLTEGTCEPSTHSVPAVVVKLKFSIVQLPPVCSNKNQTYANKHTDTYRHTKK